MLSSAMMDAVAVDERIQWARDGAAAGWIGPRLHDFGQDTGSVVPEGFEAYCRVFHPDGPNFPDGSFRSWGEIARSNGRVAHSKMQFHRINRAKGSPVAAPLSEVGPSEGSLPIRERQRLLELLRPETGTSDLCWYCIWEGHGNIEVPLPVVQLPERNYGLYSGSIDLAMAPLDVPWSDQSPNLWWPDDRAWIVVTEIDFAWSYVGGSQHLIDDIVSDSLLEAMPVHLDDAPFWISDTVNVDVED